MLDASELPRDEYGWPQGRYNLRMGDLIDDYPGAHFRAGVAAGVEGRHVARLVEAFGGAMEIAPADAETAEACARHVFERTKDGKRAKVLRAMFAKKARRKRR